MTTRRKGFRAGEDEQAAATGYEEAMEETAGPRGGASTTPVRAYVDALVDRLVGLLEGRLTAAYLLGSLALGDYVPGRSDIDVAAVASDPIPDEAKQEVVAALSHPNLPCPTKGLEFVLYARDSIVTPTRGAAFEINLNTGPGMAFTSSFDPASEPAHWFVIDRSIARTRGIRLVGPPSGEMFAEIPRRWVLEAVGDSLEWHRETDTSPNLVLNACRAWYYVEEGTWTSKSEAAAWARRMVEDPAPIDAALVAREQGAERPGYRAEVSALIERVEDLVKAALDSMDA